MALVLADETFPVIPDQWTRGNCGGTSALVYLVDCSDCNQQEPENNSNAYFPFTEKAAESAQNQRFCEFLS